MIVAGRQRHKFSSKVNSIHMLCPVADFLVHVYTSLLLHAVMVLVGNKTDLAEQREVSEEEARAFADRWACSQAWRRSAHGKASLCGSHHKHAILHA
jgi:GTPase SAR1 family protein